MGKKNNKFAATLHSREWLQREYVESSKTAAQIGLDVGCPTSTVLRWLRRFGFTIRNEARQPERRACPNNDDPKCLKEFMVGGRGGKKWDSVYCSRHCHMKHQTPRASGSDAPRPRRNLDTLHNEGWLRDKYVEQKWSMGQIAQVCNCSTQSVKWALDKFSIPLRPLSEAMFGRQVGRGDRHDGDDPLSRRRRKAYEQGQELKREMVAAYGGCCECCGEKDVAFLSLDHVDGGGSADRLASGGSTPVLRRLKKLGWPKDGFRCLCMNCNVATRHGRTCPHQLRKQAMQPDVERLVAVHGEKYRKLIEDALLWLASREQTWGMDSPGGGDGEEEEEIVSRSSIR